MPTVVLAAFVAAFLLAMLTLSGCGMSQLERHMIAASSMHGIAGASAELIEADAQRAAHDAIRPCIDDGAPVEECDAALASAMQPRRRAAQVQALYASAADSYVLALLAVAQDRKPDFAIALTALSRVMDVYSELAALLSEYGITLPNVGPIVIGLLSRD
jgi:hypothetical protein